MRKITLTGLFALWVLVLFGCTNTETGVSRRSSDTLDMGGANYASAQENESNAFGTKNPGLDSQPLNKPSKELLGDSGQYEGLVIDVKPRKETAYINEIIEFTIDIKYDDAVSSNPQFVVVLEKASGANGSLVVDSEYLFNTQKFPPESNRAVVKPDASDKIIVRVQTGTHYNNSPSTPMYYLNVWHADADKPTWDEEGETSPAAKIFVKRPPQIGVDSELTEGTKDVDNDLTVPVFPEDNPTKLSSAMLVLLDSPDVKLYALGKKKLAVQLEGKCGDDTATASSSSCKLSGEPICWTFVETTEKNPGKVEADQDQTYTKGAQFANPKTKTGINSGCGKTNEDGTFWAEVNTGSAYNARYYLNFFHPLASPATYQIDTYALPATLGDTGSTAAITEDELKVDLSEAEKNPETGNNEISGCSATKVLSKIFADEDDDIKQAIEEKCGKIDPSACDGSDGCSSDSFTCKLTQLPSGTWAVQTCDGKTIMHDVDGDGFEDPIHLVFVQDDEGNSYFNGYDTDGDGIVDVAADPCLYMKSCGKNTFVCSTEKSGTYKKCSKINAPMNEALQIFVKTRDSDGSESASGSIHARIIRGPNPPNNAMLNSKDGDEETDIDASTSRFTNNLWSGTAYDALYYIELTGSKTKSVLIPVAVLNSMSIPTAPGDKPDPSAAQPGGEAWTAPGEMGAYIPDIGPVVIELPDGAIQSITAPVVKTLDLRVIVRKENKTKTLVQNTKTWWKVTRGKSKNNNATLVSSVAVTNSKGVASDQLYTGTGYDSLYYVSVFHPNYLNDKKEPIPFIFTVLTSNNTGSVPGPTPGHTTYPEGTTTLENGKECSGEECNGQNLGTVNGQKTSPKYPQGPGCTMTIDKCSKDDAAKCYNETNIPGCCCKNNSDVDKEGKQGCLELQIVDDNYKTAKVGSTLPVKVRLVWRNGTELTPVRDNIIWTLDKDPEADGSLLTSKTPTDKDGYAMMLFRVGSKVTTYVLNAMYPNIHKDGNMVPHKVHVAVSDAINDTSKPSNDNIINLQVDSSSVSKLSFNKVSYYVFSSYYVQCGEDFVFAGPKEREKSCNDPKYASSENKKVCDLSSDKPGEYNTYNASSKAVNHNDRFVVYAVADKDGEPVAYGCSDMNLFGSATTVTPKDCDKEDKDSDGKCPSKTTREMNVKVKLSEMPDIIQPSYKTKTLVNIGPLMKKGSQLDKALDSVFTLYDQYISADPAEKIMNEVFNKYLFVESERNDCVDWYRKETADSPNPQCQFDTLRKCCSDESEPCKEEYKSCKCLCGTMYYYNKINKIGSKVMPLIKKGIKALLKKYLSPEAIQSKLCSVFDGIQFVTLTGDISLEPKDGKFTGSAKYSGANIPFTSENIDLTESIVEGKWREAKLTNNVDQLSISGFTLNFTYGEFIYKVVGKLIGAIDTSGDQAVVSFAKIIDCDKIFGKISLPIVGSLGGLSFLCNLGLQSLNNYTTNFAVSKTLPISMTLQGSAEFERGEKCEAAKNGAGCQYLQITKGIWEGTGTLGEQKADGKTPDSTLNGIWIGYIDGFQEPEMKFGDKTKEEFIAENSLCRQKIQEKADGKDLKSNKACLLGSYDNVKGGTSTTACKKENCKNSDSIVVCSKDGTFNSKYASATPGQIIIDANKVCKAKNLDCETSSDECCQNPEVINGGKGITNEECDSKKCAPKACQNNPSIFVCDGSDYLNEPDENGDNLCSPEFSDPKECYKAKVKEACMGKCDEPGCIMNSELENCQADENAKPEPKPSPTPDVIAEWKFDSYFKDGKANDADLTNDIVKGLVATSGDFKDSFTFKYFCSSINELKLVSGPEGSVDAVSTKAVNGDKSGCYFSVACTDVESSAAYTITKLEYNLYGATRTIHFETDGGVPAGVINTAKEWRLSDIDFTAAENQFFGNVKIWGTIPGNNNANPNDYSPMRLHGIKVYGIKKEAEGD